MLRRLFQTSFSEPGVCLNASCNRGPALFSKMQISFTFCKYDSLLYSNPPIKTHCPEPFNRLLVAVKTLHMVAVRFNQVLLQTGHI